MLFVNDGSKDRTWSVIREFVKSDRCYRGISLSRNRGHQNALLSGLMEIKVWVAPLGVIGEYVGKTYLETKRRPRFIIAGRTEEES